MSRPRLNPVFLTVSSGLCRPVAWGPDGRPAALLQPRDRDYIQAPMHMRRSVWRLQNYPACREGVSRRAGRWGTRCPEKMLHVCSPRAPAQRGCLSAARKCTQRPGQISLGTESLLSTKKQQPLTPVRLVFYRESDSFPAFRVQWGKGHTTEKYRLPVVFDAKRVCACVCARDTDTSASMGRVSGSSSERVQQEAEKARELLWGSHSAVGS